jgi:hypothetical protein
LKDIGTDLGYIVISVYLFLYGCVAIPVGVLSIIIRDMLFGDGLTIGLVVGQLYAIITTGIMFSLLRKSGDYKFLIGSMSILVNFFIGIIFIKTALDYYFYAFHIDSRFIEDIFLCVSYAAPSLIGVIIGDTILSFIRRKKIKSIREQL